MEKGREENDALIRKAGMAAVQGVSKETQNPWLPRQMTEIMSIQSILKNHILHKESEKEMMSCCFPQSRSRGHRVLLLGVRAYKAQERKIILSET